MVKNIILLIFVLALGIVLIRRFEWKNIFFPTREFSYMPDAFGLKYEDIFFEVEDDMKINAWFIPSLSDGRYTVLFAHGNGGNISHRIEKIAILYGLGLNIFIYDYRGYGKSSGVPTEQGIYEDTHAAYNYLIKKRGISADSIIVYGESLGAVAAVDLVSRQKAKALILEGAFTNAKDMSKEIYPFLPTFILQSKLDSLSKIKSISVPKLFIHSQDDEIVPIHLSRKLFDAALEPKVFKILLGGHNTCFMDSKDEFTKSITSFIAQIKDLE